jgi:Putative peptidoglycan binding domain
MVVTGAVPLSPSAAALPEPASLLPMAAATPTPAPPSPASPSSAPSLPSPATDVAYTPAVLPAAAQAAAADSQQAPFEPAPNQTPLRRDEAREVQARLRSFGFNPGLVDGAPGAMTEDAIRRYSRTGANRGAPRSTANCWSGSARILRPRLSSAPRAPLRSPDLFARTAALRSVRTRAGRGRSPRPMAGFTATLRRRSTKTRSTN